MRYITDYILYKKPLEIFNEKNSYIRYIKLSTLMYATSAFQDVSN